MGRAAHFDGGDGMWFSLLVPDQQGNAQHIILADRN